MKDQADEKKGKNGKKAAGKAATQREPLTQDEIKLLHDLITEAEKGNHNLVEQGHAVEHLRMCVRQAEAGFEAARKHAAEIHAKIAPLLHRLPTV